MTEKVKRTKYETNKDRWWLFFVPIDLALMMRAEAAVRGWSNNAVMRAYFEAYREAMAQRATRLELRKRQPALFEELPGAWELLGYGDVVECGESEADYMELGAYLEAVEEKYQELKKNHELARKIARDRAIKKAIASKGQRAQHGSAVAEPAAVGRR